MYEEWILWLVFQVILLKLRCIYVFKCLIMYIKCICWDDTLLWLWWTFLVSIGEIERARNLNEEKSILAGNCSSNPPVYPATSWPDSWPDWKGRLKNFGFATASNPASNPTENPAKSWSDCDVAAALSFCFRFSLEHRIKVLLHRLV